jgi:hypothetical protein
MWENVEQLRKIISESYTKTEVLNKMGLKNNGGNYNTLTSFIRDNSIDIQHFQPKQFSNRKKIDLSFYKDINNILVENSIYRSTNKLKSKLYKEGLKNRFCEMCGQTELWMGKKIALILDHINGDRYDNRLENLRILCPNCNASLDTHCRGLNVKPDGYEYSPKSKKCTTESCSNMIRKKNHYCKDCWFDLKRKDKVEREKVNTLSFTEAMYKRRTVERPPYKILIEEIKQNGYSKTGRKYGVSDNAIRKWLKFYEKSIFEKTNEII